MKQSIIQHLHVLVSHNVIGDLQFRRRYNGFIGELDFREWFSLNRRWEKVYNGGFFLPTVSKATALDKPVYFTVSDESPEAYRGIYQRIALLNCRAMFFIKWDSETPFGSWSKSTVNGIPEPLPVPRLAVYRYDVKSDAFITSTLSAFSTLYKDNDARLRDNVPQSVKVKFSELLDRFDEKSVLDLYVQRLIFDGYVGFAKVRGIPSDVDQVIATEGGGQLIAFEVKEKDLSKRAPIGFGMDIHRIGFFETFMEKTGIDVYYIIKQINNQRDRKLIAWRAIKMTSFIADAGGRIVQGGTGMRSLSSSNPTKICPEKYFLNIHSYT